MAIESVGDRRAYMAAFGETVSISGVLITAIYDDPYLLSLDVATSMPMLHCITADISGVTYSNPVIISGAGFTGTVREIQHDGTGMSTIMLGRTS